MSTLHTKLAQQLHERSQTGNLRSLSLPTAHVDFFSNDYLGLARNALLKEQINTQYQQLQLIQNGSTGSRLLSGNSAYAVALEEELAHLFGGEAALLFNSGYVANTALLATLPQRGDTIIADALIHASLHEGCRLSYANSWTFRHNDLDDLEKKLRLAKGERFVVVESVYSMDGDNGVLSAIAQLCTQYEAQLIVDEAHSTGIFGKNGNGLVNALGLAKDTFARVYTFGKAMGSHGACIVGSSVLIDYLVNFAKAFIYTTALPLHSLVGIRESFAFLARHPYLVDDLQQNIRYYQQKTQTYTNTHELCVNDSPIQVIGIQGNVHCKAVAQRLVAHDLEVRAILSPTVPLGGERLRICLHNYNTPQEIDTLLAVALAQ